jgi:hypothetical protein
MYATFKKNIFQMSLCDENRPSYIVIKSHNLVRI